MNEANIDKLIAHLQKIPARSFSMNTWRSGNRRPTRDEILGLQEGHTCGTNACIAGHADLLMALDKGKDRADDFPKKHLAYMVADLFGGTPKKRAKAWLGLTDEQADALFMPRNEYWATLKPHDAIVTLQYMKATGGVVDWRAARKWAAAKAKVAAARFLRTPQESAPAVAPVSLEAKSLPEPVSAG